MVQKLLVCSLLLTFISFNFSHTDVGFWQHNTKIPLAIKLDSGADGRVLVLEVDGQEHVVCKSW